PNSERRRKSGVSGQYVTHLWVCEQVLEELWRRRRRKGQVVIVLAQLGQKVEEKIIRQDLAAERFSLRVFVKFSVQGRETGLLAFLHLFPEQNSGGPDRSLHGRDRSRRSQEQDRRRQAQPYGRKTICSQRRENREAATNHQRPLQGCRHVQEPSGRFHPV